jgi:GGDEF domain-containing protein
VVIKVSHVRPCVPRSAVTDLLPKRSWATKKVEHLIQKRRRSQLEMATFILDLEFWKVL